MCISEYPGFISGFFVSNFFEQKNFVSYRLEIYKVVIKCKSWEINTYPPSDYYEVANQAWVNIFGNELLKSENFFQSGYSMFFQR